MESKLVAAGDHVRAGGETVYEFDTDSAKKYNELLDRAAADEIVDHELIALRVAGSETYTTFRFRELQSAREGEEACGRQWVIATASA